MLRLKFVIGSMALINLVNCATYTVFNPIIKEVEFTNTGNATKTIVVNNRITIIEGSDHDPNAKYHEKNREEIAAILKESHFFRHVRTGFNPGDLKLHVIRRDTLNINHFLKLICLLSYFLIPSHETRDVVIKYQFKDNNDNLIKEYERQIIFHDWIHLILLPVMPFKSPLLAHDKGLEAVTKSVLYEANQDGVFK